jgi:hypothetical protein
MVNHVFTAVAAQSNEVGMGLGTAPEPSNAYDGIIYQVGRGAQHDMEIMPLSAFTNRKLQHWNTPIRGNTRDFLRYYANPGNGQIASGDTITMVPCAKSGTSILQFLQVVDDGFFLFDDWVARMNLALAQPNAVFKGMFCQHGEEDAVIACSPFNAWHDLMPNAAAYEDYFNTFLDRAYSEFGHVFTRLAHFSDGWENPQKAEFDAVKDAIALHRPTVHVVDTAGLPNNSMIDDRKSAVHFSALGQYYIGKRSFHAYRYRRNLFAVHLPLAPA